MGLRGAGDVILTRGWVCGCSYNTTIFAYGQTGTGKTHTMLGVDMWAMAIDAATKASGGRRGGAVASGKHNSARAAANAVAMVSAACTKTDVWGIIPRAMQYIFQHIESHKDTTQFKVTKHWTPLVSSSHWRGE